ncbi:Hydroxymethylglutaryl-CoA lyase [Yarrowia sp. B02]|nr:Hydroxymethylglutaryl-CoA lyase [Yarrowia sp. B02]
MRRTLTRLQHHSNAFVRIVEVSPRDGLQNEKKIPSTETKTSLIDRLVSTGLQTVEVTSFVSPKWVPAMADNEAILKHCNQTHGGTTVDFPVLTPNAKGMQKALELGAKEVAIFAASSDGFAKKNTNCTVDESFERFEEVLKLARNAGHPVKVRGYLSTVIGCPYDGPTEPARVAELAQRLIDLGCYEVSLGDTIGVGTPGTIEMMLDQVMRRVPADKLAIHAHDTYGQGVANVMKAVDMGVRVVDASVAGLGGCPYAKGATGNVATEDVVYALHGSGYDTGVNLDLLAETGEWISKELGRPNGSRAGKAIWNNNQPKL